MTKALWSALFVLPLLQTLASGATVQQSAPVTRSPAMPTPRTDAGWVRRHEQLVQLAGRGPHDLIFIGDSITQGWETDGKQAWQQYYGKRRAANFGISGDRTQHVLWRLQNGLLDALVAAAASQPAAARGPRLAVVMIGTNNSNGSDNTAEEIADGIAAIVRALRERLPGTKILLLAIFPRHEKPDSQRQKNAEASKLASKLADGKTVFYLDIGDKFLDADGTLSRDIMPDLLHLSPRGYQVWAEAIEPTLTRVLGEAP